MLCTKCSQSVSPIVAVDIDGTLGDYHGHFLNFAQQYLNRPPVGQPYRGFFGDTEIGNSSFGLWFANAFRTDLTTFRQIKLAYRQGAQKRTMPTYEGMPSMMRVLKSLDVEVWLTTTRPYLRLDGVDPDTREWLARHRIPYDGLLYDEDKYRVLAERVDRERVVAVLDDLPEQYDNAERLFGGGVPILARNVYNSGVDRAYVARGSSGALKELELRIASWKIRHG